MPKIGRKQDLFKGKLLSLNQKLHGTVTRRKEVHFLNTYFSLYAIYPN